MGNLSKKVVLLEEGYLEEVMIKHEEVEKQGKCWYMAVPMNLKKKWRIGLKEIRR